MDRLQRTIDDLHFARMLDERRTGSSGHHPVNLPSYLTNKNGLELADLVAALAETAAYIGIGFHFWELFLNSSISNARTESNAVASYDRLTVSYRASFTPKGGIKIEPHVPTIGGRRVDADTKSLAEIQADIASLCSVNRRYRSGKMGNSHYERLYEHFRYFCLNTFVQYLIKPDGYGFRTIGITSYFDNLLATHPDIAAYTKDILEKSSNRTNNDVRETLRSVYIDDFRRNLDELDHGTKAITYRHRTATPARQRCYSFLLSLRQHADDFTYAVLDSHSSMPLDCLKAFFQFATNVYLPWTVSATSGDMAGQITGGDALPKPAYPAPHAARRQDLPADQLSVLPRLQR